MYSALGIRAVFDSLLFILTLSMPRRLLNAGYMRRSQHLDPLLIPYTPYALLCTGYLCRLQHLDFHSHALCSLSNPHELFVLNIYAQSNYLILHSLCSLNKKLCTGFMCCLPHTVSSLVQGSFNTPFLLSFSVMELFKLYLARSWLLKDFLPAYI